MTRDKRPRRAPKPASPVQTFLTGAETQGDYVRASMRNTFKVFGVVFGLMAAIALAFLFPPLVIVWAGLGGWWLVRKFRQP